MPRLSYALAVIPNGASQSNEFDARSHDIVGVEMPAVWTAAGIAFKSCIFSDGQGGALALTETFLPVVDQAGAEIAVTAAASKYIVFSTAVRDAMNAAGRLKIVSGTNAVPVNQGQAVTLRLIVAHVG